MLQKNVTSAMYRLSGGAPYHKKRKKRTVTAKENTRQEKEAEEGGSAIRQGCVRVNLSENCT